MLRRTHRFRVGTVSLDLLVFQSSLAFALAVLAACYLPPARTSWGDTFEAIGVPVIGHFSASWATIAVGAGHRHAVLAAVGGLAVTVVLMRLLRAFRPSGRFLAATQVQFAVVGTAWGIAYISHIDLSVTTKGLMLAGVPLLLVTMPIGVLALIPPLEALARTEWRRPRTSLPPARRRSYLKVSVHVPICSEPPHVVLATLEALAAMDYPRFEVLVIDNNTRDEALWRPVQQWCRGDARFRFFHLNHCPGAKAGALNFARQHTADDASVVALVDSDYQARPTFLSALVGYFDDPRIGFVQTPHDYRDWQHSLYQRMCYWEYRSFFTISLPSWNEREAAITVGTMSLIRRSALDEAGGWSEWCLTEDSELAPRIHARGYTSVYVQETFGRGLIPERFSGYAKQRRRWTYGPIQELRQHAPMFLPRPLGVKTALTTAQKLFHLHHDLDPLFTGTGLLLLPLGLAVIGSMLVHGEEPSLPWLVIAAGLCAGVASQVLSWRVHRKAMQCSVVDVLCASVAKAALGYTIATSALRAMFGIPLAWQRTDKFRAHSEGLRRAFSEARAETVLGALLLTVGGIGLSTRPVGLLLLILVGMLCQGIGFLTAPAVAALAEWELRRASAPVERLESQIDVALS